MVISRADNPFSGLLSANRVEIERLFSLEPQVPFRMQLNVGDAGATSMLWHWKEERKSIEQLN